MIFMVNIKDDYIMQITVEDLDDLKENESIEMGTDYCIYKIHKDAIITLDEVGVKFIKDNEVIDLEYEDIEYIYKITHYGMFDFKEKYFIIIYLIILAFVCIGLMGDILNMW